MSELHHQACLILVAPSAMLGMPVHCPTALDCKSAEDFAGAEALTRRYQERCIVASPSTLATRPDWLRGLRAFRASLPLTPILLGDAVPGPGRLPRSIRPLVDHVIPMRDTIECWRGVETIARAQLPSAAIEPDLLSAVPAGLRKEYLWLLRNSYMAITVTRWSRWCGLHPATLRRRSQLFAAPSPSLWLRLSRALHVAARLDLSPCKIAAIAADLAFSSAEALTMFMRRAVGAGATDLRSGGAIARVLDHAQTLFQLPSLAADATVLAPGTHISADGSVRCPLP